MSPTTSEVESAGRSPDFFVGRAIGITLGSDGFPLISYLSTVDDAEPFLKLAKCANFDCSSTNFITVVDSSPTGHVGYFHGLTVGADGRPVLSYRDEEICELENMRCANAPCIANWTRREGRATGKTVPSAATRSSPATPGALRRRPARCCRAS